MTTVSSTAGQAPIAGSAFVTPAEAKARGWVQIRGDASAGAGVEDGPRYAQPLTGFVRLVEASALPGLMRGGAERRPTEVGPDDPVTILQMGERTPAQDLAEDMPRVEALLGRVLRENGIDPAIPLGLSLDRQGAVVVDPAHPRAEVVQGLLDARPDLSGDLARVMHQNDRLAHFRLMEAGLAEAREGDGVVTLREWDAVAEEARSVQGLRRRMVMVDGALSAPIQAEADRLLGLA